MMKFQPGRARDSSSYSVCSARWSAIDTKSAVPLRLTCKFWTSPKSRRRRGPALRAARSTMVNRPEWEGIQLVPDLLSLGTGAWQIALST